jgi:demethylmenaquinone methyltransferase / 2-methoxy-6-polyprenyl-1,4-benzoquinol methylase
MNTDKVTYENIDKLGKNKQKYVAQVFDSVAHSYDLMNDLMSMGAHRIWKKKFVNKIHDYHGKLLDVAGGTGDIAKRYYLKAKEQNTEPDITLCDINEEMLSFGKAKLIDNNIHSIKFSCGNAESLPYADSSFDYYTIAFGIRNVSDIKLALKEAYRVLKPGGRFLCLEFSKVEAKPLTRFYDIYSSFIPSLGDMVVGDRESYQYLIDSIKAFPTQRNFATLIESAGFEKVNYENLSFGVVAIHSGWKT